jgi:hypothetical protein
MLRQDKNDIHGFLSKFISSQAISLGSNFNFFALIFSSFFHIQLSSYFWFFHKITYSFLKLDQSLNYFFSILKKYNLLIIQLNTWETLEFVQNSTNYLEILAAAPKFSMSTAEILLGLTIKPIFHQFYF